METREVKVNFGASGFNKEGYINVDIRESVNPDVIHDLNIFPYPFADNSVDRIELTHVLEHLEKPFGVMHELHRILKPGGALYIAVPHFSRGFTHAEHEHGFDVSFPYYFRNDLFPEQFYGVQYDLESLQLNWISHITLRYLPQLGVGVVTQYVLKGLNSIITWLANVSPMFCSRIWCFWVGGFEEMEFTFKKPR
ncbi:class I SAM-dependent methyltransferase [Candidatus Parcubacteria bacterium]|nr:class I SAM-dependent methyltransferase [Candidatus Parcubacteria bacterium]